MFASILSELAKNAKLGHVLLKWINFVPNSHFNFKGTSIGESLFTIFASLAYATQFLMDQLQINQSEY